MSNKATDLFKSVGVVTEYDRRVHTMEKRSSIKSNILIRKCAYKLTEDNGTVVRKKYKLSVLDSKIVNYLCAIAIEKDTKEFDEIEIEFAEIKTVFGFNDYKKLQQSLEKLEHLTIEMINSDPDSKTRIERRYKVFSMAGNKNIDGRRTAIFKFAEDMRPLLLNLERDFTKIPLTRTLEAKSTYELKLYEFLKSILYKKEHVVEVEDLKHLLNFPLSRSYNDLKREVLNKYLPRINKRTEVDVINVEEIKARRRGVGNRKVNKLKFIVREKRLFLEDNVIEQIRKNPSILLRITSSADVNFPLEFKTDDERNLITTRLVNKFKTDLEYQELCIARFMQELGEIEGSKIQWVDSKE